MSIRQVKLRGGTEDEHLTGNGVGFIGAEREVTVDTTNKSLRVHDGVTIGGHLLAKAIDVYDKKTIDEKLIDIASGGAISLDGYATIKALNEKANLVHTHDYATINHTHNTEYASFEHGHSTLDTVFADGQSLQYKFENNLLSNVDISDYVTREVFNTHEHQAYSTLNHTHEGYSASDHTHGDVYSSPDHTHPNYITTIQYNNGIKVLAPLNHTHILDELKFLDEETLKIKLGRITETLDNHNHDKDYYSKAQVDTMIKKVSAEDNYIKLSVDSSLLVEATDGLYCYTLAHNQNCQDLIVKAYDTEHNELFIATDKLDPNNMLIITDTLEDLELIFYVVR